MTERAEVVVVHGETATVRCETSETCASCSTLMCNPRARTYRALVGAATAVRAARGEAAASASQAGLRVGDRVEVEVPERGALGKGTLLFALPLASFVAVYLGLGDAVAEALRVGLGFAGLAAGLAAAVVLSRFVKEPQPEIVRVYRDPELAPFEVPGRSGSAGAGSEPSA